MNPVHQTAAPLSTAPSRPALDLLRIARSDLTRLPATQAARVLGIVCFGAGNGPGRLDAAGCRPVQAHQLHPRRTVLDVWLSDRIAVRGRRDRLEWSSDGQTLFGSLDLPDARAGLEAATGAAYRAIFDLLDASGYAHLLRVWNYFPSINDAAGGLERYRQFNIGRQDAFLARGRPAFEGAPAACALGTAGGALSIRFLAARRAALAIENPRQVSAYRYPVEYGPRSPSFSRAVLATTFARQTLFISGTASIVGHESLHHGDVREQTREILRNLEAVVAAAGGAEGARAQRVEDACLTVYLRHAADCATVRAEIERRLGAAVRAVYVQADICRSELLVEIEAVGFAPNE